MIIKNYSHSLFLDFIRYPVKVDVRNTSSSRKDVINTFDFVQSLIWLTSTVSVEVESMQSRAKV